MQVSPSNLLILTPRGGFVLGLVAFNSKLECRWFSSVAARGPYFCETLRRSLSGTWGCHQPWALYPFCRTSDLKPQSPVSSNDLPRPRLRNPMTVQMWVPPSLAGKNGSNSSSRGGSLSPRGERGSHWRRPLPPAVNPAARPRPTGRAWQDAGPRGLSGRLQDGRALGVRTGWWPRASFTATAADRSRWSGRRLRGLYTRGGRPPWRPWKTRRKPSSPTSLSSSRCRRLGPLSRNSRLSRHRSRRRFSRYRRRCRLTPSAGTAASTATAARPAPSAGTAAAAASAPSAGTSTAASSAPSAGTATSTATAARPAVGQEPLHRRKVKMHVHNFKKVTSIYDVIRTT
ncbi:uncharacterized protein [Vicugna pacos]|uniref:Uncharacterized protein n=1 Tax=Vicugna pacos TaxID=30538 RepID=A0ABM5CXT9_VICPA